MKKIVFAAALLLSSQAHAEWRYSYSGGMDMASGRGPVLQSDGSQLLQTGEVSVMTFGCNREGLVIVLQPNTDINYDDRWEHRTPMVYDDGAERTLTWNITDTGELFSANEDFIKDVMSKKSVAMKLDQTKGAWFDLTNSFRTIARAVRECVR